MLGGTPAIEHGNAQSFRGHDCLQISCVEGLKFDGEVQPASNDPKRDF
jgi:hypothetical protein